MSQSFGSESHGTRNGHVWLTPPSETPQQEEPDRHVPEWNYSRHDDGVHISSGGDTYVSPDSVIGGRGGGVHISSGRDTHVSGSVISGGSYRSPYPMNSTPASYDALRGSGAEYIPWSYADWQRTRRNGVLARLARRVSRALRRNSRR